MTNLLKAMAAMIVAIGGAYAAFHFDCRGAFRMLTIEIEPTRVYRVEDAREMLTTAGIDVDAIAPQVDGKFMSAFVRVTKPAAKSCCGPTCCN